MDEYAKECLFDQCFIFSKKGVISVKFSDDKHTRDIINATIKFWIQLCLFWLTIHVKSYVTTTLFFAFFNSFSFPNGWKSKITHHFLIILATVANLIPLIPPETFKLSRFVLDNIPRDWYCSIRVENDSKEWRTHLVTCYEICCRKPNLVQIRATITVLIWPCYSRAVILRRILPNWNCIWLEGCFYCKSSQNLPATACLLFCELEARHTAFN